MKKIMLRFLSLLCGFISLSFILGLIGAFLSLDEDGIIFSIILSAILSALSIWGTTSLWKKSNAQPIQKTARHSSKQNTPQKTPKKQSNKQPKKQPKPTTIEPTEPASEYAFNYVNSKGKQSRRTIMFRSISRHSANNSINISGVCTLRYASRTFKVDNMKGLVNVDTGECINDSTSYFENVYAWHND